MADERLRVGLLFEFGSLNGGEFSMLAALDQAPLRDMVPVAVCFASGPLIEALSSRGIVCRSPPSFLMKDDNADGYSGLTHWLNEVITEFDLHLLHANSLTMSRRSGRIAPHLRCPVTGHLRDIMKLSRGAVAALNQLRRLAAVSAATRLAHLQQGIHRDHLETIYNGIDPYRFRPGARTGWLHRELNLPANVQLAATVGQICLRKGQNDLAAAAVQLGERFPQLHYLLIGQRHSTKAESVEFDASITRIFVAAKMGERLHRLEFREEIPRILHEIDVLIHPARQEPLGRVLLEAGASGVPILATNVGGTCEILTHGKTAWLVPPDSPAAIAEGMAVLLSDPLLARRLAAAAHREVTARFSVATAVQQLLAFWARALHG